MVDTRTPRSGRAMARSVAAAAVAIAALAPALGASAQVDELTGEPPPVPEAPAPPVSAPSAPDVEPPVEVPDAPDLGPSPDTGGPLPSVPIPGAPTLPAADPGADPTGGGAAGGGGGAVPSLVDGVNGLVGGVTSPGTGGPGGGGPLPAIGPDDTRLIPARSAAVDATSHERGAAGTGGVDDGDRGSSSSLRRRPAAFATADPRPFGDALVASVADFAVPLVGAALIALFLVAQSRASGDAKLATAEGSASDELVPFE